MGTKTETGERRYRCIAHLERKLAQGKILTAKQHKTLDALKAGNYVSSRRRKGRVGKHRCDGCGTGGHSRTRSIIARTADGVMVRV